MSVRGTAMANDFYNPFYATTEQAARSLAAPNPAAERRAAPVTESVDFRNLRDMMPQRTREEDREEQLRRVGMMDTKRHMITGGYRDDEKLIAERDERYKTLQSKYAAEDAGAMGAIPQLYTAAAAAANQGQELDSREYLAQKLAQSQLYDTAVTAGGYAYNADRLLAAQQPERDLQLRALYGDAAFTNPLGGELGGELAYMRDRRAIENDRADRTSQNEALMLMTGMTPQQIAQRQATPEQREAAAQASLANMKQAIREAHGIPAHVDISGSQLVTRRGSITDAPKTYLVDPNDPEKTWLVPNEAVPKDNFLYGDGLIPRAEMYGPDQIQHRGLMWLGNPLNWPIFQGLFPNQQPYRTNLPVAPGY
jgi:hypothetical protein